MLRFFLGNAERMLANLCLAGLVLVLSLQVAFRYGLGLGLSWSEEVSRFCFVFFVYLSASLAVQKATHLRVGFFVDLAPEVARVWIRLAGDLIWTIFNILVVISGVLLVERMIRFPVYSTSLFLPLAWIYAVIPLAHLLMILRLAERYWRHGLGASAAVGGEPEKC